MLPLCVSFTKAYRPEQELISKLRKRLEKNVGQLGHKVQPATTEVNKRPQIITRFKTYGKLYHCFYHQVHNLLRPITDEIKGSSNMVSEKNLFKM